MSQASDARYLCRACRSRDRRGLRWPPPPN